jgi:hypothetical protein
MKKILLMLFVAFIAGRGQVAVLAQTPHQDSSMECRIVDMVVKKSGEVDYVDGKRVPGNFVNIDYLREQEKSSPRSCLRLFVTSSVKIQDIEDFRVVATGKMQYQDFHAYLYDPARDSFSEILYGPNVTPDKLRPSPRGTIPWPGSQR